MLLSFLILFKTLCIGVRRGVIRVTSHPLWQPSTVKMRCKCGQNSTECIKISVKLKNG